MAVLLMMGGQSFAQNKHQYVDLGLPSGILWATCNVGANKPEEYGDYLEWGITSWAMAITNWGDGWRMPTKEEWQELLDNTTNKWTTQNGVNGMLFIASNGNSLFLPAAGHDFLSVDNVGLLGYYWSSSFTYFPGFARYFFYFGSGSCRMDNDTRYDYCGRSLRAVRSARQK